MSAVLFDTNALINICRENDVAKLEVFGSTARGEANDDSDIDLLVEFSKRKSLLALVSLERKMSAAAFSRTNCSIAPSPVWPFSSAVHILIRRKHMPQNCYTKDSTAFTSNSRSTKASLAVGLLPRRITFALCLSALVCAGFLAGCGKDAGGNSFHVKSPATGEKDVPAKSSYAYAVTKSFTDTSNRITTASAYRTYAANYDLDATNFSMTMDKPLTSDDQVRVEFSLVGEQGTDEKAPPKAGTYSAKADKFMKVETVGIVSRKGGADNKVWLDRSSLTGEVKVTSASADEISGDVDISAGDTSIKGSFTAKIVKRK